MSDEQRYFDALRRIAKDYQTSKQLLRGSRYSLLPSEELGMAYDNIKAEATAAIKGRRRPQE